MPFSSNVFDYYIVTVVSMLKPSTVCDIGPGMGKYSGIVRSISEREGFATHITAYEIDPSYVDDYSLREKYDTVVISDAIKLIESPRTRFDLIIIGDCIEHMKKSDAVDLINFLIYRSGYICIVYPDSYVQDDWEGHSAEAHISVWSIADFVNFNTLHKNWSGMHLFLLKGYQPSPMIITG